jgi:hypothetical protein
MNDLFSKLLFQITSVVSSLALCCGCSSTKDISKEPPYNQCIGKKFILKEDMYIFKFNDSSQCSIAGAQSGIIGLPRYVDKKYLDDDYFGRNNRYLSIQGIIEKESTFTLVKVINKKTFESSYVRFLIAFNKMPIAKNGVITTSILNLDNPPFTKFWSDPPIFDAKYALPLPSDGIWWK